LKIDAAICNNENTYEIRQQVSLLNNIATLQCILLHVCTGSKMVDAVVSGILQQKYGKVKYTIHDNDFSPSPDDRDGHYSFVSPQCEFAV